MIRPKILNELQLQAQHSAVAFRRKLEVIDVSAPVDRAQEVFPAGFDPLHRFMNFHGDEAHQRLFGINIELAAEAATHLRSDHSQPVLRDAEHLRHKRSHQMRNLRRRTQRQRFLTGPPLRNHSTRLHRRGNQPLAGDALFHHDVGLGKRLVDVPSFLVKCERDIVRPFRMNRWCAGRNRFLGIGDRRQWLVIHFDQIDGIPRNVFVCCDRDSHCMADKIDAIRGQDAMVRNA